MRIAVDAMGGDYAPEAIVEGACLAAPDCAADLSLIGDELQLRHLLGHPCPSALSIDVVHAPETIDMAEAGPMAVRKKPKASLSVAMRLLAAGAVDAVVSAGNSAAIVATAKHFVGLLQGIRRPAMAVPLPTRTGKVLLLDAGAHAETDEVHLVQSAALASIYLQAAEGFDHPRIGLINIGQEPGKGLKRLQGTFDLLKRSSLHFIGNVEPHDLFADRTDAAICDGFVGNVLLKMYEGLSETLLQFFEAQINGQETNFRSALQHAQEVFLYQNVGGAPLLGIRKPVIVAHGRSHPKAIANAIQLAHAVAEKNVYSRMADMLEEDHMLSDLKHYNALFVLEKLKKKWGFTQH